MDSLNRNISLKTRLCKKLGSFYEKIYCTKYSNFCWSREKSFCVLPPELKCSEEYIYRFQLGGHRVSRVLSFFSSRRNWDSPTPSPAGECALPPLVRGEGHTRWREKGWESPNSDEGTYTAVLYLYTLCRGRSLLSIVCGLYCICSMIVAQLRSFMAVNRTAKFIIPDWGDKVDSGGIGLSYRQPGFT
jgi:hypothetical protein